MALVSDFSSIFLYFSLFLSLFFEIFLLITYFEIRGELIEEEKNLDRPTTYFPTVSIIVPCYNEEKTVKRTIQSLLSLDYPTEKIQIIAVDDGSTDGTAKIIEQNFSHEARVRLISKDNGGKHTALNLALEQIDTELVGCLDADSFVEPQTLKRMLPHFANKETMAVTPSIKIHEPKTVLQHGQSAEYARGIFLRRLLASLGALYVTPGPFTIFRTRVFKELGGYKHAHQTEDMEMALRMHKHGYKIANAYLASVHTVGPAKLKGLLRQRVRWTYGFLNNVLDYREMLLRPKYGNMGMFILPIATITIFLGIIAAANALKGISAQASTYLAKYQAVGIHLGIPHSFSINWFAFNFNGVFWLVSAVTVIAFSIMLLSLKMTNGSARVTRGVVYYVSLFIFIVPIWLTSATYSTIVRKRISWK